MAAQAARTRQHIPPLVSDVRVIVQGRHIYGPTGGERVFARALAGKSASVPAMGQKGHSERILTICPIDRRHLSSGGS